MNPAGDPNPTETDGTDEHSGQPLSKAEAILLVLNNLTPVDLDPLKFTVITDAGNWAIRGGEVVETNEPQFWPFEKGEILINDGYGGREPFGERRKPSKWDVADVGFDTLEEALECQRKVLAGEWPRRYASDPGVSQ